MGWFILGVLVFKAVTGVLYYRRYEFIILTNKLTPQIESLRQQFRNDPPKADAQINRLYENHGSNAAFGMLDPFLDCLAFLILVFGFSPKTALQGKSYLWITDAGFYSASMPLLACLLGVASAEALRRITNTSHQSPEAIKAEIGLSVVCLGVAYYFELPAFWFICWILVFSFHLGVLSVIKTVQLVSGQPRQSRSGSRSGSGSRRGSRTRSNRPGSSTSPPVVLSPVISPPAFNSPPKPKPKPTPAANPTPPPSNRPKSNPPPANPTPANPTQAAANSNTMPATPPLNLQAEIDKTPAGGTLTLDEGVRYIAGPVTIRQPMTLNGGNCRLWAKNGPVITIEASQVTLKNLRLEVTDSQTGVHLPQGVAIQTGTGNQVTLEQFGIRGGTEGLSEETGDWRHPTALELGNLKPDQPHEFLLRIATATECTIHSEIACLTADPKTIAPGISEVRLKITPIPDGTRLRGALLLRNPRIDRVIELSARALNDVKSKVEGAGQILFEPSDWDALANPAPPPNPASVPVSPPIEPPPEPSSQEADSTKVSDTESEKTSDPATSDPPTTDPASSKDSSSSTRRRVVRPGNMSGGLFDEENS